MIEEIFQSSQYILLGSLLLIISILVTKFSTRVGVPTLVLFIGVGMLFGSDGLNVIYFDNADLAQFIGMFALVVILFEGGLQTKWQSMRPVIGAAITLATLGVIITSGIVAVASMLIFDISWLEACLVGSIVGSTDAAAVFAVLKGKNIKDKIESTLEAESGTNDPMAVFLTISFIQLIINPDSDILSLIGSFFWQMCAGLIIGLILGKIASASINRINLDSSGLYPLFALSFAFLSYSLSSLADASGLLAVYITAIVIGNSDLTYRHSILRFNEGFGWMMQILMFIILGLFVFPTDLFSLGIVFKGLMLSIVLMFIARPIATFISLIRSKYKTKEKLFLSWAGLRGAVPIVLAIFPLLEEVNNSQLFFNAVFFVVITSTLIQGSTITFLATKFNLISKPKTNPIQSLEVISIGKNNAEIVEYDVTSSNKISGCTLEDIELPASALINAIIRKGEIITPHGQTVIQEDDTLYIMVSRSAKKRLREVLREKKPENTTSVAGSEESS